MKTNNKTLEQEILLSKLNGCFPERNSDNESEHSEHPIEDQSNNMFPKDFKVISLINKVYPPRWYAKVHIVVASDYAFDTIALIDTGANLNCIQEGLVPSKYFEKSIEKLSSASGNKLQINFKLNNAHVCQHNVCFHIPSVLVKDMSEKVILGISFIAMIYPFTAEMDGVSTVKMGIPIKFQFASRFEVDVCHRFLNMLPAKIKHLNFLKQDVMYKKISEQISNKLLQ